jgi:hypothetical protein
MTREKAVELMKRGIDKTAKRELRWVHSEIKRKALLGYDNTWVSIGGSPRITQLVYNILKEDGFEVRTCKNGAESLLISWGSQ